MAYQKIKLAKPNWKNDHLQFARLIAECIAVGAISITDELRETMDLDDKDINEIMDRAQDAWEEVKTRLMA